MPALTATGSQGSALAKLVQLLAACPAFLARRDVATAAEAEEHIYWPWFAQEGVALNPLDVSRPFLVVENDRFGWTKQSGGGQNYLYPTGAYLLTISDEDRYQRDYKSSLLDFLNFADGVTQHLAEQAALDDSLAIINIEQTDPPMQNPQADWGVRRYWLVRYTVEWDPLA